MRRKPVLIIALMIVLIGMLGVVLEVERTKAGGTIYIRADGSVQGTDKILRDGDVYTFTDDIFDSIVVERDNILINGAGRKVVDTGSGVGISLSGRINVTIKNMEIRAFYSGIYLECSSNNTISAGYITNNRYGIILQSSDNNLISSNNITNNTYGIEFYNSSDNSIYHNSFVNNTSQVFNDDHSMNIWDDSYPSGGNYWSYYIDVDQYGGPYQNETGSDGVWDHPYTIDENNQDSYPMVPEFPSIIMMPLFMTATILAVIVYRRKHSL